MICVVNIREECLRRHMKYTSTFGKSDFCKYLALTIAPAIILALTAQTSWAGVSSSGQYWLQGDISAGFQRIDPSLNSEIPKDGSLLGARFLGEYRHNRFGAFGLGVGVQQTWQDGETETRIQQYMLRSFVGDASYLYPIGSKSFSLGWLVRSQTGKGGTFDFGDIDSVQTLITTGPQLRINFEAKSWDWVVGAALLKAVNSSSREIINIPIYMGISIPLSAPPSPVQVGAAARPQLNPAPAPQSHEAVPVVAVEFDASLITFDLNKAILKPKSEAFLEKLANILKEQKDNWQSIEISGHTDIVGSISRNKTLSLERAQSVMLRLIMQGIPADRLTAVGYGSERTLSAYPATSEKNRRVELLFKGVLDGVKINDAMSALKSQE